MKKINIVSLILLLVTATGCSKDFLAEENKSNVVSDDFFSTVSGYEQLVTASYASLRTIYSSPFMYCAGTDMYLEAIDVLPVGLSEYRTLNADDGNVTTAYRDLYKAVQNCNTGLYYNDKTAAAETL